MADKQQQQQPAAPPGPAAGAEAPFARRIVDTSSSNQEGLSAEQVRFIRQTELQQWGRKSQALRGRNVLTGLAIGAVVAAIYGYTFYAVGRERIMDEMDEEAKRARMGAPKTDAN